MAETKVLVIDSNESQARVLETLLRFLDLEPVLIQSLSQMGEALQVTPLEWLAVIVSSDSVLNEGTNLGESLRSLRMRPPVIHLSSDGLPKIADTTGDISWFHLEAPVKQRRLSAVLAQIRALRGDQPAQVRAHRFRPSGESPAMHDVHRLIEQVAPFDANVLLLGESGTGKEMAARHIHELSRRADQPFVPVNCGAIPADLLESELFGHEKGAFTGALSTRLGRFEFAEGGTLFLDEIGDMSLQMQVKLLRVLQERSFERVGSNRTIRCDVRIIAATHRDLESAIGDGQFREDLFYRLNVFPVQMPPLRDRLEDLPVLIEFLVERQMRGGGKGIRFAPDALACLSRNFWPGNVRELANLLERLAILFPGKLIGAADLPPTYRGQPAAASVVAGKWLLSEERAERAVAAIAEVAPRPDESEKSLPRGGLDLKDHLCAIEVGLIRQALDEADGTVAEAARLLRMRRTTLVEKLRKYRMTA